MTTDLMTINYQSPEVIRTLKQTVAVGATDAEFAMFTSYCQSTGLNPFKKEVWFIKTKGYQRRDGTTVEGKVQIMTGINGFLAIANKHPAFDGLECETMVEGSKIIGARAKVHRKDRKYPSVAVALMSEYYKPSPSGKGGVWEQMPSIMIQKCAKALALREAFPQELNGLYTAEEMPNDYAAHNVPNVPAVPVSPAETGAVIDTQTGEIKAPSAADPASGLRDAQTSLEDDDLPWETDSKPKTESKAQKTQYDVSGLQGGKLEKAEEYLRENMCHEVSQGIWECPIRLQKLTSCIVTD